MITARPQAFATLVLAPVIIAIAPPAQAIVRAQINPADFNSPGLATPPDSTGVYRATAPGAELLGPANNRFADQTDPMTAGGSGSAAEKPRFPVYFSGTWEQEGAITTTDGEVQKFEALVEPRWDVELSPTWQFTGILRLRLDTEGELGPSASRPENYSSASRPWYNDEHAEISLREFYFDTTWSGADLRLGKQQVVWGQADGIKVLDVVNPQSYREFILDDFDDSRIPTWMINAEMSVGSDSSLQFLWIPDTTYAELAEAGTPFEFTSPRLVPQAPENVPSRVLKADKPDDPLGDSDAGVRYSTFAGGWDVTLNYLYHYQDLPVPYQELRFEGAQPVATLVPEYERNHLVGGTLSNVFGNLTLRSELAYNTDTYHVSSNLSNRGIAESSEFASVIGLDWQLSGSDAFISAQWFQSHLLDYSSDIERDRTEHNLSLLFRRSFANETWNVHALGLYSPNHTDSWLQLKLSYQWSTNLELWLGADVFSGDREGLYGQFKDQDRVLLGLELGF